MIAGNLKDMLMGIQAVGCDVWLQPRCQERCPIPVNRMKVAGSQAPTPPLRGSPPPRQQAAPAVRQSRPAAPAEMVRDVALKRLVLFVRPASG
jgi:hypothetical protein